MANQCLYRAAMNATTMVLVRYVMNDSRLPRLCAAAADVVLLLVLLLVLLRRYCTTAAAAGPTISSCLPCTDC